MTARTTRRGLLAGAGASGLVAHNPSQAQVSPPPHPDAELLAVCAELRAMEQEWHRLHALTSDGPGLATPEDHAWAVHEDHVWPNFGGAAWRERWSDGPRPADVPARLLDLRAITVEGLAAKAAAVRAVNQVPGLNIRDDSWELSESVIDDAANLLRAPA